ncbi:MAG: hypothetical protein ACREVE_12085 [Gammaproteobacteria bacterium]
MIVMLSAGLVGACGGGGGGQNEVFVRTQLTINASNGVRLAKDVVAGAEVVSGSGSSAVLSAAETSSRGAFPGLRALTYDLALNQLNAGISDGAAITTAATVTENCPGGGTRTINAIDKNNNGRFDAGDSGGITYNNCTVAGVAQNGTLGFDVISLQGNPDSVSSDWSFTFGFRFENLSFRSGAEGFSLNGGYNLAANYRAFSGVYRFVIAGARLSFASGADTAQVVNFNFTETLASASSRRQVSYSYTHDSSEFAGSAIAVANVPFRGIEGFPPESGKLTIRGANGSRAVVEATGGGTATIAIDANGDGDSTDSMDRVVNGQWTQFFG